MRTPPETLDEVTLKDALEELNGWHVKNGKLHREYRFKDFVTAFGWMSACALVAERLNHHPEWSNVWASVTVDLTTHESNGVTERDLKLAKKMELLAGQLGGR